MADEAKGPIPIWAWVFAVACGIIPVLTLGGALPAAIGIGGAAGCVAVARDATSSVGKRVAICVVITVVCWGLFLGLLVALGVIGR